LVFSKNKANTWGPDRMLASAHSGYHFYLWDEIKHTFT
jgi:hypothetical protein